MFHMHFINYHGIYIENYLLYHVPWNPSYSVHNFVSTFQRIQSTINSFEFCSKLHFEICTFEINILSGSRCHTLQNPKNPKNNKRVRGERCERGEHYWTHLSCVIWGRNWCLVGIRENKQAARGDRKFCTSSYKTQIRENLWRYSQNIHQVSATSTFTVAIVRKHFSFQAWRG